MLLSIAVVCLAGAGVITARWAVNSERESADFPDGIAWFCRECRAGFVKTVDELLELHRRRENSDDPTAPIELLCPQCGSRNAVRATRCPHCEQLFEPPARGQPTCPHCKRAMPPLVSTGE